MSSSNGYDHARPAERIDAPVVVLHVTRGNTACVLPLPAAQATYQPAGELAAGVIVAIQELQRRSPERATEPILHDDTQLALRPRGADEPLNPDRPLLEQTPGHWRLEDVPVESLAAGAPGTRRLPVGAFELIDLERPSITL